MAKITHLEEVTSTSDIAKSLALKGAPNFTCVTANKQTAGRGRRGRVWRTIPHKSVACSIVLKQNNLELLPFIASLAVYKTVSEYVPCAIKWPNDVLIKGQKVSGILVEKFADFYILGIGINVLEMTKEELKDIPATSICNHIKINLSVNDILHKLLENLESYLNLDKERVLSEYRQECVTLGQEVTWKGDHKTLKGVAQNITETGSLILNVEGTMHEILSGDILA